VNFVAVTGQPYGRKQQALLKGDKGKLNEPTNEDWLDDQLALSDYSDDEENTMKAFEESLIPKSSPKSCSRVIKFYWFWFVLIITHLFVFFGLPSTVG